MRIVALMLLLAPVAVHAAGPFHGRWDMVITAGDEKYPGWMEVDQNTNPPHIRVQPRTGHVEEASGIKLEGSHLSLSFKNLHWDLTAARGEISGTQTGEGGSAQVHGVRAPELKREPPKSWSAREALFNGKDLSGWEPEDPATNHWVAQNGVLLNQTKGSNLRTTRKFQDFKLHVELNCPQGGNSGIYLRGRYEIQVAYEEGPPPDQSMGAIYGFLAPSVAMPRKPGQWESFDATLVGRRLTLIRDGVTIMDNVEIPGITGGALDSNEADPGPFVIQGDHTGGMKYRNITIAVPGR